MAAPPAKGHHTTYMTRNLKSVALAIAGVISIPSCAPSGNATASSGFPYSDSWPVQSVQQGKASWYSVRTNYGTRTASGQRLNNTAATAAHKTLPLGTKVRVTNVSNGKAEVVTITDRGPYIRDRIIDVTVGVAERLGFASRGVIPVKVEVLTKPAS
ncbi:MAG: hypothetical protein RLZZ522_301 [Verrucomicrobiota bacterium]|jgi:rare lipoprotein A